MSVKYVCDCCLQDIVPSSDSNVSSWVFSRILVTNLCPECKRLVVDAVATAIRGRQHAR